MMWKAIALLTGSCAAFNSGYAPEDTQKEARGAGGSNTGGANIRYPKTADEVVKYVKEAKRKGLTLSVGGGMNTGWWDNGEIALSMGEMDKIIHVDEDMLTVTTQTGRTAGEIQRAANNNGMMAAIGQAAKVGVGFLLNGGFGHQTRLMGLGSDRVVGAEIVTSTGEHVCVGNQPVSDPNSKNCKKLTGQEGDDYLWSIRGAGPNFAVVLSLTVSMVELHLCDTNFQEFQLYNETAVTDVFVPYGEYARAAPNALNVDGIVFFNATVGSWVLGVYNHYFKPQGSDKQAPAALSIPEFLVAGPKVTNNVLPADLPGIEPSAGITHPDVDFSLGANWMGLGLYVDSPKFTAAFWNELAKFHFNCPNKFCYTLLQHAGGAQSDVPINDTAFGASRGIEWMVYMVGVGYSEVDSSDPSHRDNIDKYMRINFRRMLPLASGTYLTDLSPTDYEFIPYAFGVNMDKLCQLKRAFDPNGMFSAGSAPLKYWCDTQSIVGKIGNYNDGKFNPAQSALLYQVLEQKKPTARAAVMKGIMKKDSVQDLIHSIGDSSHDFNSGTLLLMCFLTAITLVSSTISLIAMRRMNAMSRRLRSGGEGQELLGAGSA